MSTVQKVNFEPLSDLFLIQRRDKELADPTLGDPYNALCLVDGEWVVLDDNEKFVRATVIGTPGNLATRRAMPLWNERGRSDTQSIRKWTSFYLGDWEANTRIYDAAAALGGGAAITFVGQLLKVATITLGSRNYTGLVGAEAASTVVVGEVTKLPAQNGGKLRFKARR